MDDEMKIVGGLSLVVLFVLVVSAAIEWRTRPADACEPTPARLVPIPDPRFRE